MTSLLFIPLLRDGVLQLLRLLHFLVGISGYSCASTEQTALVINALFGIFDQKTLFVWQQS